jgi:hypothetical protein
MSRTLVRPAPDVARAAGAVLLLGIAGIHFVTLPHGFQIEAYVGVSLVLGFLMAMAGVVGLLAENKNRIWWYALIEGVLNVGGWFATRVNDLPVTRSGTSGDWFKSSGLLLFFAGSTLSLLASWVLRVRTLDRRETVTSARQRVLDRS